MHPSKLLNFERERGKEFPPFRQATHEERARIWARMRKTARVEGDVGEVDVAKMLLQAGSVVPGVNTEDAAFDLGAAIRLLRLPSTDEVFLHWESLDDVDVMSLADFASNFGSIWYPSADDLFVYDRKLRWLIMVLHYGVLKYLRLGGDE